MVGRAETTNKRAAASRDWVARANADGATSGAELDDLVKVNPDHVVPLYHQIKEDLKRQFRAGGRRPEQEVPSEAQLEDHYAVSRGTIRWAVDELVKEGASVKIQEGDAFVENSVLAFYHYRRAGGVPDDEAAKHLMFEHRKGDSETARGLQVGVGTSAFYANRVCVAHGIPVSVERSDLPGDLCRGLDESKLAQAESHPQTGDKNLYPLLERVCRLFLLSAEKVLPPAFRTGKCRARWELKSARGSFSSSERANPLMNVWASSAKLTPGVIFSVTTFTCAANCRRRHERGSSPSLRGRSKRYHSEKGGKMSRVAA